MKETTKVAVGDKKSEAIPTTDKVAVATENTAKPKKTTTTVKAKSATKKPSKKIDVKETVIVQFDGKSYSNDELVRMAKDIWRYDLRKRIRDITTIEVYVKIEESMAYYVINGVSGSFAI